MAYTGTPVVRNQWLLDPPQRIRVGSQAWWTWLATAHSFNYRPLQGFDALTLRKEKRRQRWYWFAYVKSNSKLHNAYAGRSQDLTRERLEQVAQRLKAKLEQQRRTARQPTEKPP